jgi:hypothetical protein
MPQATSHSTDLRMTLSALRDLYFVWIYPKRNLIAVIRWIDRPAANEFFSKLVSALKEPEGS